MQKINYKEFVTLVNQQIGLENDLTIAEIVKNNGLLGDFVLSDDYFSTFISSKNEEAIKEVAEIFIKDGFNLVNQDFTTKMLELFDLIGVMENTIEDEEIIKHDDEGYYISLIPQSDEISTFYSFLNKYADEIYTIAVKYDATIKLELAQLDDKITGTYSYSKEYCEGVMNIYAPLSNRDLYIACCMINQASGNEKEFEMLNGTIYVEDIKNVEVNEENMDVEGNQEILKNIVKENIFNIN